MSNSPMINFAERVHFVKLRWCGRKQVCKKLRDNTLPQVYRTLHSLQGSTTPYCLHLVSWCMEGWGQINYQEEEEWESIG
jgi:hypothetical protein